MFAKLYETKFGQILVKKDLNENNNPEVKIYFELENGHGASSFSVNYEEKSKELQHKAINTLFDKIAEEDAMQMVAEVFKRKDEILEEMKEK